METVLTLLKMAVILIAAIIVGNWYQTETKKIRKSGKPWYRLYTSPPGLLILAVILLPIFVWLLKNK